VNLIPRGPPRSCTFRVGERSGVWYVNKNDSFYGDYLSRGQAIEAACFGARTVEAQGGVALVVTLPGEVPVAHRTGALKTGSGRKPAYG
jgi:hypothetical protein